MLDGIFRIYFEWGNQFTEAEEIMRFFRTAERTMDAKFTTYFCSVSSDGDKTDFETETSNPDEYVQKISEIPERMNEGRYEETVFEATNYDESAEDDREISSCNLTFTNNSKGVCMFDVRRKDERSGFAMQICIDLLKMSSAAGLSVKYAMFESVSRAAIAKTIWKLMLGKTENNGKENSFTDIYWGNAVPVDFFSEEDRERIRNAVGADHVYETDGLFIFVLSDRPTKHGLFFKRNQLRRITEKYRN